MNFCVDFGAEDAGRLTPFKDDKPKDTENSPFEASSVLVVKAKHINNAALRLHLISQGKLDSFPSRGSLSLYPRLLSAR